MSIDLSEEVKKVLTDINTLKVFATVDQNGEPYVVFKDSIHLTGDGKIELYEILESSQNNKNLVYAIWFDKTVSVNLLTVERKSYQIKLKPVKCITAGHYFEETYIKLRENLGDVDLGAIWQFEPVEVKEETLAVRIAEEENNYPLLKHLDRLLSNN